MGQDSKFRVASQGHCHKPSDVVDGSSGNVGRRRPGQGGFSNFTDTPIVFLTVNTKNRTRWLNQGPVQKALENLWRQGDAWLVGDYLIMPNHIHLFCVPHRLEFSLEQWVIWWKRKFSCLHLPNTGRWQRAYWDTDLRGHEKYSEKWQYVRENPVRAGLVENPDAWPYQGRLNTIFSTGD